MLGDSPRYLKDVGEFARINNNHNLLSRITVTENAHAVVFREALRRRSEKVVGTTATSLTHIFVLKPKEKRALLHILCLTNLGHFMFKMSGLVIIIDALLPRSAAVPTEGTSFTVSKHAAEAFPIVNNALVSVL